MSTVVRCPKCQGIMTEVLPEVKTKAGKTYHCEKDSIDICEHMLIATSKYREGQPHISDFACIDCNVDSIENCECMDCMGGVFCEKCNAIVAIQCSDLADIIHKNDEKLAHQPKPLPQTPTTQVTLEDAKDYAKEALAKKGKQITTTKKPLRGYTQRELELLAKVYFSEAFFANYRCRSDIPQSTFDDNQKTLDTALKELKEVFNYDDNLIREGIKDSIEFTHNWKNGEKPSFWVENHDKA